MPESVTIHIGPVKTGTTSIQVALAAAASDLRAQGVYYEIDPAWGAGHFAAILDLLRMGPAADVTADARVALGTRLRPYAGAWPALVDRVMSWRGDAIISHEFFGYLGPTSITRVVASFPGVPVRVVAIDRPASRALPSVYQQLAKVALVPDFEHFVAQVVQQGKHRTPSTSFRWLDARWLRLAWESAGADVHVVPARPDLSPHVLEQALAVLLPAGVSAPQVPTRNVGFSALGLDVWREVARRARPRYLAPALSAQVKLANDHAWATDSELGGRYRIAPAVAATLDAEGIERAEGGLFGKAAACKPPLTERCDGSLSARVDQEAVIAEITRFLRVQQAYTATMAARARLRHRAGPDHARWTAWSESTH